MKSLNKVNDYIFSFCRDYKIIHFELAKRSGLHASALSQIVNDTNIITEKTAVKLSKGFDNKISSKTILTLQKHFKTNQQNKCMSASELIKEALKSKNMTYKDLSNLTKISIENITCIMQGTRIITPSNAIRIANVLKYLTAENILYAQCDTFLNKEFNKPEVLIKPAKFSKLVQRKVS